MRLSRQFLYLVVDDWMCSPRYTLHRIDPSNLFYTNGAADRAALAAAATAPVDAPLPEPTMSFSPSERMQFALFGRRMDKILGVDYLGRGILYEDDTHAVRPLPTMTAPERHRTLSIAVPVDGVGAEGEGSVYFIEAEPTCDLPGRPQSVEVLVHEPKRSWDQKEDWAWRSLLPPPYVHELPGLGVGGMDQLSGEITCHGMDGNRVVNGSLVWVSTAGRGTYWLAPGAACRARPATGALPFWGCAVRIPENDLWFGFSVADSGSICASNLYVAIEDGRPQVPDQVWEGLAVPEGCREIESSSSLVYLGNRRFCVAKMFRMTTRRQCGGCICCNVPKEDCFAMFTGVELVRGDHAGKWHHMVNHTSLRYHLGEYLSGCVL